MSLDGRLPTPRGSCSLDEHEAEVSVSSLLFQSHDQPLDEACLASAQIEATGQAIMPRGAFATPGSRLSGAAGASGGHRRAPARRRATSRSGLQERHECPHATATGPYFATETSNERHSSGQPSGRADSV